MKKISVIMCILLTTGFEMYAEKGAPAPKVEEKTNPTSKSAQEEQRTAAEVEATQINILATSQSKSGINALKGRPARAPKTTGVTFGEKETPSTLNENGFSFKEADTGSAGTSFNMNSDETAATNENPALTLASPDVTTTPGTRSYSQAASDKINNAFSKAGRVIPKIKLTTGNQKTTTTSGDNTTVITKDKNGHLLASKTTNKLGQVIQTVMVNPVSTATTTVRYNDPTGKDKSTTTVINKPGDPNSPITELRDKDGTLTSAKDKNGNEIKDESGKPIATKTTMTALDKLFDANNKLIDVNATPDKMFSEDVTTAQFQAAQKFQTALMKSSKVTINTENLSVKALGAPEEDVNAAYRATRDFEKATRDTVHSQYNELTSAITAVKGAIGIKVNRTSFTQDLVQKQIDNRLGSDIKSGQSKFVLSDDLHKAITDKLVKDPKYDVLFNPDNPKYKTISPIEKLNLIADMGDVAINTVSEGIATFKTTFAADGTCTSTTESTNTGGSKIKLSSSFDNSGNPTENSITVDGTTYTTTVGKGWTGESTTKATGINGENIGKPLTSKDGAFLSQAWILNKSIATLKLATKIALSAPKQVVINGVGMIIALPVQVKIVAVYLPVVKIASMIPAVHVTDAQGNPEQEMDPVSGEPLFVKDKYGNNTNVPKYIVQKSVTGYQFTGQNFNDPAVRLATLKLADICGVGDDGTSLPSRALGYAIGAKGPLMATGKGSPVFNPDNPIAKGLAKLQGKTPEQAAQDAADLNASYATIIDPVIQAVQLPLKFLFPQSIGDQILSKSDLQPSESTSALDVLGRVLNPKQLISALK